MPTVDLNEVRLEYVEQGQGDPLVLVHGGLCDFRYWHFQMKPFSQHYRTIAYSRRYHYPNVWVGDGRDYSASYTPKIWPPYSEVLGSVRFIWWLRRTAPTRLCS
jgi:pimeloyl-ACP methyl ester carboxylesterase